MRIVVAGDINQPLLLNTTKATAILIETDDGKPAFILRMLPNGRGYVRSVRGEDKNFNDIARQEGLI